MVVLCLIWSLNNVAAKLAVHGVSYVMQSGLRSLIAATLLWLWAYARGVPLFGRDGTLLAGLGAGALFGIEFLLAAYGLNYTTAARMSVFVYLAPVFTALGLTWLVPEERLDRWQWLGVFAGFAGVAVIFSEGFTAGAADGRVTLIGDLCGVLAGAFWGATTVLVRATRLNHVSASKTLFYQVAASAPILVAGSLALGEPGIIAIDGIVIVSLLWQGGVISFATFLAWFWLLKRYLAGPLAVFSFLTPLFGVAAGVLVLGEPLTARLAWGALGVGAGILLVNRRRRPIRTDGDRPTTPPPRRTPNTES